MITRLLTNWGMGRWAEVLDGPIRAMLFIAAAYLLLHLGRAIGRKLFSMAEVHREGDPEARKRVETLRRIANYMFTVIVASLTAISVMADLGVSIAPFLATAGIAGVAIGFGAQSLVKDYFTGLVLLLENQIRIGDSVEIGGKSGTVDEVTLRYVRLRDYQGAVHYIPNGTISAVTNSSRGYAYAVLDVRVPYEYNVDAVLAEMREVAEKMANEERFADRMLEPLEIAGVEALEEYSVRVRARVKVRPTDASSVRRELLRRFKLDLDQRGMPLQLAPSAPETVQRALPQTSEERA